jgi:glucose-6-phosphate dehydrogenase assembly protein OpcA
MTPPTPLVALQKPKDISVAQIEAELAAVWHAQQTGDTPASRAATFSMVVYEPEEFQQLLAALGFYEGPIDGIHGMLTKRGVEAAQKAYGLNATGRIDLTTLQCLRDEMAKHPEDRKVLNNPNMRGFTISDAIAAQNPCRIITLCPDIHTEAALSAQVSAYCPLQKKSDSPLVCCEYVTLRGAKTEIQGVGDLVTPLLIPGLPKFVWWKATPNPEQPLFRALAQVSDCMVFDSCYFSDAEGELLKFQELIDRETYVADLNWHRLSAWQELTASAYDAPERRAGLLEIDRVVIDYEKGNPAQAWLFLGWLASRLLWKPMSHSHEGGTYDLHHIKFLSSNQREVEIELAAIPVADWGEVPGDLVGLHLSSTNPKANCSTILCSESTGCMRMESGGSAQYAKTEQVEAPTESRAEALMAQQLQSWGRDMLYEESLAIVSEVLKLPRS